MDEALAANSIRALYTTKGITELRRTKDSHQYSDTYLHVYLEVGVVGLLVRVVVLDERLDPGAARPKPQQREVEAQRAVGRNVRRQTLQAVCA